jgi:hypothetical protein
MKLDMQINPLIYDEDGFKYCLGTIFIGGDFSETIALALNYWTIDDYKRQWETGLHRIKDHDTSCLVASVQNPKTTPPYINWWLMYKVGNKVLIQNHLLVDDMYRERVGNKLFTPKTCYDFILPRVTISPEGDTYSEWEIDLE